MKKNVKNNQNPLTSPLFFSRESTPNVKNIDKIDKKNNYSKAVKNIELYAKPNNLSLDFKRSPNKTSTNNTNNKYNKDIIINNKNNLNKIIKRNNNRTGSVNSFIGYQTMDSFLYPYSRCLKDTRFLMKNCLFKKSEIPEKKEEKLTITHKQVNSYTPTLNSENISNIYKNKFDIFSMTGLNKLGLNMKKTTAKKKHKKSIKKSYLINPSNIQINFNTVGNSNIIQNPNKEEKMLFNLTGNSICLTKSYKSRQSSNKKKIFNISQNFRNHTCYQPNRTHYYYAKNNKNLLNNSSFILSKLKQINNEMLSLLENVDIELYPFIFSEIEKIYKKVKNKKLFKNSAKIRTKSGKKVAKKSKSGNIPKFENIDNNINDINSVLYNNNNELIDNGKLREKNENLSRKICILKKKIDNLNKDNSKIKTDLNNKTKLLNEMKMTIDEFNKELKKLQREKNNEKVNKNNSENNNNKCYLYENDSNFDDYENISLADNLNINNEIYQKTLNNKNTENIKDLIIGTNDKVNNTNKNKISFKLNLGSGLKKNSGLEEDFNSEFLKNYDKFSESWRKEVDKMLKRRNIKK